METRTKCEGKQKETSTTPTKAQVEVIKEETGKASSSLLYHQKSHPVKRGGEKS